jgi:putative ABC transport system substrate-binding protein
MADGRPAPETALKRRELLGTFFTAAILLSSRAARAQQKAMPVIGFLSSAAPGLFAPFLAALKQGLSEAGYTEGQNLALEYRWAEGHYDRLPALAADLVGRRVDLIVASGGTPSARAAKNATSTIPVVFTAVSDPLTAGLVASLARPGGNITGFSIMGSELMLKRLQLLLDLVPGAGVIAVLVNPNVEIAEDVLKGMREAAEAKGIRLHILKASTDSEIDAAFVNLTELHAGALLVGDDPFFTSQRKQLVALAASHAIPAIYQWRDFVAAGGLISYGVSLSALYRLAGIRAGKILGGARAADLPIEQPAAFELVINLKTAGALGLTVPPLLLARAGEVIE